MMPYPNGTKFTVELASTQGGSHIKFEEDPFSHSRDTSNQNFEKNSSFSSFHTLCGNRYNSRMRALI